MKFTVSKACWAVCCVASACCAGVLCAALWGRYAAPPAMLALQQQAAMEEPQTPFLTICQYPSDIADSFLSDVANDGVNGVNKTILLAAFVNALEGKEENTGLIQIIDDLIRAHGYTLLSLFSSYTSRCESLIRQCRLQNVVMPCETLFISVQTEGGICCTTRFSWFTYKNIPEYFRLAININLELTLNCLTQPAFRGCKIYVKYFSIPRGDELIPVPLEPGHFYLVDVRYTTEDHHTGKVIKYICNIDNSYSEELCLMRCIERYHCKCRNAVFLNYAIDKVFDKTLPSCRLEDYRCLKTTLFKDLSKYSCKCLPSCTTVTRKITIEKMEFKNVHQSIDPLMSLEEGNLTSLQNDSLVFNSSQSTLLRFVINRKGSKMLVIHSTETWVTLLASWGGVFNMFLGVGLFGVLGFLLVLAIKLLWQLA